MNPGFQALWCQVAGNISSVIIFDFTSRSTSASAMHLVGKAVLVVWLSCSQMQLAQSEASPLRFASTDTISQYVGGNNWLIVMIWAHDCSACNEEIQGYVALHEQYKAIGASVLGVSIDGAARQLQAGEFFDRHKLSFDNLLSEPEDVFRYYENMTQTPWIGTPSFLVFDPQGNLAAKQAGALPANIMDMFLREHLGS